MNQFSVLVDKHFLQDNCFLRVLQNILRKAYLGNNSKITKKCFLMLRVSSDFVHIS